MTRVLHIAASPRGAASVSRSVAEGLVASLRRSEPQICIETRDLGAAPPPHPDRAFAAASLKREAERGAAEHSALALSETLIGELERCDILVLSTPMHNFSAPSALKAWIDHVVRPGRTFRVTAAGKVGLLADRPVLCVIACGGRFVEDAAGAAQVDFLSPYLRYLFGVIGLASFEALRLDELGRGEAAVARSLENGRVWIDAQLARLAGRHS